jgi:TonB family protein
VVAVVLLAISVFAQEGRKVLVHPQPVYPDLAKELSLRGSVRLEVVIGSDGEIKSTKVLGGHPILAQAVTEAVKKWKYAPASGETTATLEFSFRP